ncbi:MAG: insulinase family protein [Oscillospiraceae bacterium]|jgi:predicted Zn-dependent peptidase|nr:insulinase family protein [Oscillospiraceae bacterium]
MRTETYKNVGETLITETLSNGLTINIVPKPGFLKSYAMFTANYGGADRRFKLAGQWLDTPAGVAHFLEHKMFDMPDGNALNILSARGASPNAFTSSGLTAYHFACTSLFEENLRTLLSFVSTPYFTPESVQKEQGIIGQEIRMVEDDPGYALYYNLLKCLYRNNPVRDSVAGTVESISEITSETLYHCHEVFYRPANMTLSVIGSVDPDRVTALARELLPAGPGEVPERDYGEAEGAFPHKESLDVNMAVSAPQFLFGTKLEPAEKGEARLRQRLTGELALRLLFGASSPLYNSLYAGGLLNGSFDYELDYTAGTATLIAGGVSRNVGGVMDALHKEIVRIGEAGLDKALFENVRRAYFGSKLRMLGSFSSLAQALAEGVFSGCRPLGAFEEIAAVSLAETERFIRESFAPEKLALSVVSPPER